MTQRKYADYRGVSPAYITHLKHAGRLVFDGSLVDVEASDALIDATGGTKPSVAERHARDRAVSGKPLALKKLEPKAEEVRHGEKGFASAEIRRRREEIKRQMKLIELGLLRGAILERADVDHHAANLGVTLRASLDALIERLAPRLAGAINREQGMAMAAEEISRERRRINRALVKTARNINTNGGSANA